MRGHAYAVHQFYNSKEYDMAKKTSCPITREQFRANAKQVPITIAGQQLAADVKEFSTGSLGWYLNGKTNIEIDGVLVSVQIGLNLTIVGSKELPGKVDAGTVASDVA
jgi:hypothetical protein